MAFPVILRREGFGLEQIGNSYMILFPWMLKFLWAPIVDRYGSKLLGHYRGWLIFLQIALTLSCFFLSYLNPVTQYNATFLLALIISIASSTQDIATDATAVKILDYSERSIGNGLQSMMGFIGYFIGGGLLLMAYNLLQWKGCLMVMSVCFAISLVVVFIYKEKEQKNVTRKKLHFLHIKEFVTRKGMFRWTILLMLAYAGISIGSGILPTILVDIGWGEMKIAFSTAAIGGVLGAVSAILAGIRMQKISRKRALVTSCFIQALLLTGLFIPVLGIQKDLFIMVAIGVIFIGQGLLSTAVATAMMDYCKPGTEGSDYTLQDCMGNFGSFTMMLAAMYIAGQFGYAVTIIASIFLGLLSCALFYKLYDNRTGDAYN